MLYSHTGPTHRFADSIGAAFKAVASLYPKTRRGAWIGQVWAYTLAIAFGIGILVAALANDHRMFYPIAGLSLLVGIVGTLLAIRHTPRVQKRATPKESIFRPL
jgi:hypothetical protein